MITVFTPAYNRAHLLPRLYESLCKQTFKDFEWVIVDDGSTDGTKQLFHLNDNLNENVNWAAQEKNVPVSVNVNVDFPIRYFYQENGGKHRAVNRGVKEAKGELFFIADSDDVLPVDALEIVANIYEGIKDDPTFAGVCGLDGTFDGKVIGSGLPQDVIDGSSIEVRFQYGVSGDMKEVFRTDVLKEFSFPEVEGERFCPEMLLWNRIGTKYKLRYFNQVVYLAEYQNDGITAGIVKARMKSPIAAMMTYAEMSNYAVPFAVKIKAAINYWRFRFCSDVKEKPALKWWYHWTMPIGWGMHLKDRRREL